MWHRSRRRRSIGRGPKSEVRNDDRVGVPRRTLRDPVLEAQLAERGFTTVSLLSITEVERLRRGYDELDHRHTRDSPFAEGFHTSVYDDRPSYRQAVDELVVGALGPATSRVLDDHQLIFANFTVKLRCGGTVPLHPDWTFVDETRFRSVTVWCALDDLTLENGTLGVVARSHQEVDFVRPLNIRSYDRYRAIAGEPETHDVVELAAGDAIVMDSRSIHFSPPNETERDRVTAACVAIPAEAAIEHYFIEDEGTLRRHQIDRSFYFHYCAGADPDGVPGCGPRLPTAVVDVG